MRPAGVAAAGLQAAVDRVLALDPELAEGMAARLGNRLTEVEGSDVREPGRLEPR